MKYSELVIDREYIDEPSTKLDALIEHEAAQGSTNQEEILNPDQHKNTEVYVSRPPIRGFDGALAAFNLVRYLKDR